MPDIGRARTLRKKPTWAEKLVWSWLRDRRFSAYKFRRNHPIGKYFLDFYCREASLSIELDGGQHGLPPQQPPQQMLIDGTQPADAQARTKLMKHARRGQRAPQPGEAPPVGVFGQLSYDQIERMRGGPHRQQMGAPQLRRTQGVSPSAGRQAWINPAWTGGTDARGSGRGI